MNRMSACAIAPAVAVAVLLSACAKKEAEPVAAGPEGEAQTADDAAIADALSAALPSMAAASGVMDWGGKSLKSGTGRYTCMPTSPQQAAANIRSPMCMDEPWMKWAHAWEKHEPLSISTLGISYMLAGDGGASNIDPYATEPMADNEWVAEGPHLMILVPDPALLEGIPTDPGNGGPYVMWKGTPYAHVMVPVRIPGTAGGDDPVSDALSAANQAMAEAAGVMDWAGNSLKSGTGRYTCMPTPPHQKAAGIQSPMCMDEPWMKWAHAWEKHEPLSISTLGISYMLAGDGGASNIDPFATEPTPDNQWVTEGPHLMILVPDPALLEGIPTDPGNGGPYVMWKGTPYAHVMVPVAD